MSMKTGLYQGTQLKQEMKINPRLYQAMDLLYMPLLDLQQHIKQEMLNNPFLELEEPAVTEDDDRFQSREQEKEKEKEEEEIDWEEILLDGFDAGGRRAGIRAEGVLRARVRGHAGPVRSSAGPAHASCASPRGRCCWGRRSSATSTRTAISPCSVEDVVGGLERMAGASPATTGRRMGRALEPFSAEEGEAMLQMIQDFDPPGIAARDLRECLLLQLREDELEDTLAYRIVRDYYDQLINHRWSEISKELSITPKDVQTAADEVAKLRSEAGPQVRRSLRQLHHARPGGGQDRRGLPGLPQRHQHCRA